MLKNLKEKFEGCYVPTNNQMGFMLTRVDPFVQRFVDYASKDLDNWHLDVGAAFGVSTIAALETGAKIVAIDLDESHLKIIKEICGNRFKNNLELSVADIRKAVEYPSGYFGSILFSRVLHFFTGEDIISCLKKTSEWLVDGGKIFVVNETPYFGTTKNFLPTYYQRKAAKETWPSYLTLEEAKIFFDPDKSRFVTSSVHFFDEDLMEHVAKEAGFEIEEMGFLDRKGFFPADALFDGRESLWAILQKPIDKKHY